MTRQRFAAYAITIAVAGLPVSGVAWAQDRTSNGNTTGSAVPRGDGGGGSAAPRGGDGGGSSVGSSGSSSGSSGDVGGMSSGWSAPSTSSSAPASWSGYSPPQRSSEQATRSRGGSSSTGSATPRGGSSTRSGGDTSTRSGGSSSGRTASSGSNDSSPTRRAVPAYSRPRDGRQVTGEVAERTSVPGGGGNYPSYPYYPYYPWGFWGPGYGFGLGYLYYDPWFGGGGYGYGDPYGGGGGYSVSEGYRDNGSLRLKINPKQAQIFVDGYFVGIVDSYDGSFQKLGLDGGGHKIELKADGYEPLEFEVLITPGETVTYKGEMKRIQ